MTQDKSEEMRVLHVDDEPDFLELTVAYLKREPDAFVVTSETSVSAAIDRLDSEPIDCIVSDYEMSGTDGLDFLATVRTRRPEIPFILFTARGSEDVASAAISAGVTDYMQKGTDSSQFEVLANRIKNAVETYRTRTRHDRQRRAIEAAREGIALLDSDGRLTTVNRAYGTLYGYEPDALVGKHWERLYPPSEADHAREEIMPIVERNGQWHGETVGLRADGETFVADHSLATTGDGGFVSIVREAASEEPSERDGWSAETILENVADMIHVVDTEGVIRYANPAASDVTGYDREVLVGSHVRLLMDEAELTKARDFLGDLRDEWPDRRSAEFSWTLHTAEDDSFLCDSNVSPLVVGGEWQGSIGVVRDVSDRTEREEMLATRNREVERQNEQLETLASVVSHDLRNPLNVATGRLQLAREECESEHLIDVDASLARVEEIIEDTLVLVREWQSVGESTAIALEPFVRGCWKNVATGEATLDVEGDLVIHADERRLQNLFENLLRNAVEHGGPAVSVRVGSLTDGFFVEDDGEGISEAEREQVFEAGFSTRSRGTGLGLYIVSAIADAHGWNVSACSSEGGGARFEVTGVELETG